MPAKSKPQRAVFGMALAARKGEVPVEQLRGAAKKLYSDKSLSDSDLADYAKTRDAVISKKFGSGKPQIRAKLG